MTALLSIAGCALLFLGIWGVTVTMPTKLSAVRAIKAAYARDGAGGKMHMHIEPGMMHCYASAPVFRESRCDFNKQIALLRQM